MQLREYQQTALDGLRQSMQQGNKWVILQMLTGLGKTRVAAEIVRMAREKGNSVILFVPRRELCYQAVEAFNRVGIRAGAIMAGEPRLPTADIEVASFDTVHARAVKTSKMGIPTASLAIVDEMQTATTQSRLSILNHYDRVIGLSATPAAPSGTGLGVLGYTDMIQGPEMAEAIRDGYLVPARYFAPSKPDLERIKMDKDGDYQQKALSGRMNEPTLIGNLVEHWCRHAENRITVVYCVDRAHARSVHAEFERWQIATEYLDGETPNDDRKAILERLRTGRTRVLVNIAVMTYGVDIPEIGCIVLARPTKNLSLYLQIVGRGLRPAPGKNECLILDHAGVVAENGFVEDPAPWTLDGDTKVKEQREKKKQEKKEPKEIECGQCHYVFTSSHRCPNCGHEVIPQGQPIPVHEAELQELKPDKRNREHSWERKRRFMAGLKHHAQQKGYKPGWVSHQYKKFYSVWPNDPRVKHAEPQPPDEATRNWIKSEQIRFANRREKA